MGNVNYIFSISPIGLPVIKVQMQEMLNKGLRQIKNSEGCRIWKPV